MSYHALFLALVAFFVCVSTDSNELQAQVTPAAQSVALLKDRLRRELLQQRVAWQTLERSEHPTLLPPGDREPNTVRAAHAECWVGAFYPSYQDQLTQRSYSRPTAMPSETAMWGACPWWIPPKVSGRLGRTHEYVGRNPTPAQLAPFSEQLIGDLSALARKEEKDIWPVSQLVRVLTENEQVDRARSVLNDCRVDEGWCTMLRVHVAQWAGAYREADSLAQSMLRYSPIDTRRALLDASALLWKDDALQYIASHPDSLTTHLWWLAQPFFSDSVNARRSEHFARLVRNTLAQQLDIDAFYLTNPTEGGDAKQLMRQRYGWATHNAWVGKGEDDRIASAKFVTPPPPYSAPEYSWPRTGTIPHLRAALAPLTVTDADFSLGPPDSVSYFRWWPAEFFQHKDGLILPFTSQQRVLLRRDSSLQIFVATNLQSGTKPSVLDSIGDAPVRGELWFSPAPDSAVRLFQARAKSGDRLVLHGEVRHPGIVGAEYRVNAHGLAGGRSRFGIQNIRTLALLPPGTCELSVPMLVDATALTVTDPVPLHRALLGSLTLRTPTQLGVVWESYGVTPGDTTAVAVHLERIVDIGRLRRVGITLGVAQDPTVSAGFRWTEPDPSRGNITLTTSVPVTQRHLTIGVQTLKAGEYLLQVEMQNARCGTIRSELNFTIER